MVTPTSTQRTGQRPDRVFSRPRPIPTSAQISRGRIFSKPRSIPRAVDPTNPILAILGNGGTLAAKVPGYSERWQQMQLASFVWQCLQDGEHGAGQAGTGVGKSYAYLVPLIWSRQPSLVAVPTNALLTQLITKDLPRLSESGIFPFRFTFAELKGKANYVCRLKAEAFSEAPSFDSREDAAAWPAVADYIQDTTDGDLGRVSFPLPMAIRQEITSTSDECLGESCPAYGSCYAENAKAVAQSADIIVTNLTMLMIDLDLRKSSGGMAAIIPDRRYVVIDEGHQTRERAVSAATEEVRLGSFERIAKHVEGLARRADQIAISDRMLMIARLMAEAEEAGIEAVIPPAVSIAEAWEDRLEVTGSLVRDLFERLTERLAASDKSALRLGDETDYSLDALSSLYGLIHQMIEGIPSQLQDKDRTSWEKATERMTSYWDNLCRVMFPTNASDSVSRNTIRYASIDDKGRVTLAHSPIDVAPWLRDRLWSASLVQPVRKDDGSIDRTVCVPVTVVTVSATIVDNSGSLGYFRETVGLTKCREIVVGSPFNYRDNGIIYVPTDEGFDSSVARKDRRTWAEYLDRLTDEYERIIRISGGRAFCLFTSNATLDHVYGALRSRGLPFPMMRQGELSQPELVKRFREYGNAVLFGVKSYWEGVDVPGAALSCVIISGTPFTPPDDPCYAARCRMADERYGNRASFEKISIPEATIALMQAFGRGIRTETDTAAICILDSRLRYKRYGAGILAALPPSPLVGSHEDVTAFFERVG